MGPPPDLVQWRKEQRALLLARRMSAPVSARAAWADAIDVLLETGFPQLRHMVVGFCWPFKGEYDARSLISRLRARGARAALPAVIAKKQPLEYREWSPGVVMKPGTLDIPAPEGTPVLIPDAVLMPPLGFSDEGARLGYGAGYFDRTLAALSPQPLKIGVAYELQRIPTIYPQPHDVLMDFVVTEVEIYAVENGRLEPVPPGDCAERAGRIAAGRGLPRLQS
jgi:5,10-methenyltetrahydrofolate synthetase